MSSDKPLRITLIGAGVIGLSFAVLHLSESNDTTVTICDPRPDLHEYISCTLPKLIAGVEGLADLESLTTSSRLLFNSNVASAVSNAEIIQEQGPENPTFKQKIWQEIELHAPTASLLWSSTSGIPASVQSSLMTAKNRLLVVHPYNPPHIMPLIEIVPSPSTAPDVVERTVRYWESIGRAPVVIKKEVTGFVANRLAFALLREAIHLVNEGVVTVEELDKVVESSMGPRWAKAGPFRSYHAGGGAGGFEGLMKNIGGTVQACWDDSGKVNFGDGWEEAVYAETKRAYGEMGMKDLKSD